MNEVSLFRLYLLRAMYLLITVGLGIVLMPHVFHPAKPWSPMQGVNQCMLVAFWGVSAFGLRYPLQMLPILLWELTWKTIWLLVVAAPLWFAGTMDKTTADMASEILFVVLIPFVIPWPYVYAHYVQMPGNRWRNGASDATATSPARFKLID